MGVKEIPPGERKGWTRYEAQVRDVNGRQVVKRFDSRAEAEEWLMAFRRHRGRRSTYAPAKGRRKLAEAARAWQATRTGKRTNTRARDASLIEARILPAFGNTRVDRIGTHHLEDWLRRLVKQGLSADTVRKYHQTMSMILEWCVRDGWLLDNPARMVHLADMLPKAAPPRQHFLTLDQIAALLEHVDPGFRLFTEFLAATGIRLGEACALRVRDYHRDGRFCQVTKTVVEGQGGQLLENPPKTERSIREVVVSLDLADQLDRLTAGRDPDEYLFTTPTGAVIRPSSYRSRIFGPAALYSGLEGTTPHDLRRSHGAALARAGVDHRVIADRLGDSVLTTLKVYAPLYKGQDREAARVFGDLWNAQDWTE